MATFASRLRVAMRPVRLRFASMATQPEATAARHDFVGPLQLMPLQLNLMPDKFARVVDVARLVLPIAIPAGVYGLALLYVVFNGSDNVLEARLVGDANVAGSATNLVKQRLAEEAGKFSKPGHGESANAADIINRELQELLLNFMTQGNTTSCLVVTGPRGTGKSFTVDHALRTALASNSSVRVVYVKTVSIRRIEDLVLAMEAALGLQSSRLSMRIAHWLTLGKVEDRLPLERFKFLLEEIDAVAHKHTGKHKFVFVFDDFEELLQGPQTPELQSALHYLVRKMAAWGANNMVMPVVVSSTRDAEIHFAKTRETCFDLYHVEDMTEEDACDYVQRKLGANCPSADELQNMSKAIVANVGRRVADLRMACQRYNSNRVKQPKDIAKDMTLGEKRRITAFWRQLSADEKRDVGNALRFVAKHAQNTPKALEIQRNQASRRWWHWLAWSDSLDAPILRGVDALVEQGICVEKDNGDICAASPIVQTAIADFVKERLAH
jgi:hypothetical protein